MNRRSFFGLIGKAVAVGIAIGVSPKLLAPVKTVMLKYSWVGNCTVYRNTKAVWTVQKVYWFAGPTSEEALRKEFIAAERDFIVSQ